MKDRDITHSPPGITLGRYQLLRRIGRGGMGEVWLGEDPRLHRQVAIKTLPFDGYSDQEFLQRFELEARAAAALNHPHILPVHDYGQQLLPNGQAIIYIVMPYISGGSLAERILNLHGKSLDASQALAYLSQMADAIDYAHAQGILHRDIKPANMLMRDNGWLLLADFGIARILSEQQHVTRTGTSFGTPEYMAPEQAQGHAEAASDNYSLSVIAYQLLSGRLPFIAETSYALTMQHMLTPPPPPRWFNPALPLAVEQALLHGLAKEPAQRPASAHAFVAELQQAFSNAPFAPTQFERPLPPTERDRAIPLNGAISGSSLPPTQADGATAASTGITRRKVLIGGGAALIAAGGLGAWAIASKLGQQAVPIPTRHTRPNPNVPTMVLQAHTRPITALAWSPAANILASAALDGEVMLWNFQPIQSKPATSLQPQAKQSFDTVDGKLLAWSPDGKFLAIGNGAYDLASALHKVLVYTGDLASPAPTFKANLLFDSIDGLAWAPGPYLTIATNLIPSNVAQLQLWDPAHPTQMLEPIRLKDSINSSFTDNTATPLAFSPGGTMLAISMSQEIILGRLEVLGKKVQWYPRAHRLQIDQTGNAAHAVTWSPDGRYLAACDYDSSAGSAIAVWDAASGRTIARPNMPDTNIRLNTLVWSPAPGSRLLAAGNDNGAISVWAIGSNTDNLLPARILTGISAQVQALAWSADGRWLAAGYNDTNDTILVWKM